MNFWELEKMTDEQLREVFPEHLRDRLYRITEREHTEEDIRNWMYDNYPEWSVDDADVERAAEAFPYEHDASLPYWNTIERLIEEFVLSRPRLTQEEIDRIRCDLSNAKEDNFDGEAWDAEPEDADEGKRNRWMADTWQKFDEVKLEDAYPEDEEYTHGIVGYAIDSEYTVGDFYELLGRIEEIIKG